MEYMTKYFWLTFFWDTVYIVVDPDEVESLFFLTNLSHRSCHTSSALTFNTELLHASHDLLVQVICALA